MITAEIKEPEIFEKTDSNESYKICPYCGQRKIPFKMGVCVCGKQVGSIQYVKDPKKYAKHWYSYIDSSKVEKLGIIELIDN